MTPETVMTIGQRALVIQRPTGGVMWDCTPLITEASVAAITAKGGVKAIAIYQSHMREKQGEDRHTWITTRETRPSPRTVPLK